MKAAKTDYPSRCFSRWRSKRPEILEQTYFRSKENHPYVYYNQFRLIFFVLRLFGRYCIHVTKHGEYRSRWLSLQMVYCVLIYGLQTYLAVLVCFRRLQVLKDSRTEYDDVIFSIHVLAYLNIQFHVPFTYWLEGSKMARYLTQWATFQENWEHTLGRPLKMSFERAVAAYILVLIPGVISLLIFEQKAVLNDPILYFLPYFFTLVTTALVLGFWFCTCLEIRRLTLQLNTILVERLHSQTSPWFLSRWRLLWLELRSLTASLGTELSLVLISTLLTYSTTFLLGIYNGLSQLITDSLTIKAVGYVAASSLSLGFIYTFCDGGHRATDGVVSSTLTSLLNKKIPMLRPEIRHEVYLLIEAVKSNPPEIKLAGFVTLDRPLVVGLVSNTLTYLIVLLQFKVNEGERIPKR